VPGTSSQSSSDPKPRSEGSPSADSEHGLRRHNLRRQPEHRLDLDLLPYNTTALTAQDLCVQLNLPPGPSADDHPG